MIGMYRMRNIKDTVEKLTTQIKSDLTKAFLDKRVGESTLNDVKLATSKMLAKMEAELHGYKVDKCDMLWNTLTVSQKAKWYFYNRLVRSLGDKHRAIIDEQNRLAYEADPEDYNYQRYPWWLEPSPKTMAVVEVTIQPIQPLEWISLSVQLTEKVK